MRFFKTENATVPVRLGGKSVEFTPSYFVGGGWVGFYQTLNEDLAEQLLKVPTVTEITELEFILLKKKSMSQRYDSSGLQQIPEAVLPNAELVAAGSKAEETNEIPIVIGLQIKPVNRPSDSLDNNKQRKVKKQG